MDLIVGFIDSSSSTRPEAKRLGGFVGSNMLERFQTLKAYFKLSISIKYGIGINLTAM